MDAARRRRSRSLGIAVLLSGALAASPVSAASPSTLAGPLPACAIADTPATAQALSDWDHTLLDWTFSLSRRYVPTDLVPVRKAGISGSVTVRRIVISDLAEMTAAARTSGIRLAAYSGYRSYVTQIATFRKWVGIQGLRTALRASARPGHSEHQLGTAIDFTDVGRGAPWGSGLDWGKTKAGSWMLSNAWRYGFVLSYPRGKTTTVCYQYEPWHYRYVGRTVALAIHNSGLTPREWLWSHPAGLVETSPSTFKARGPVRAVTGPRTSLGLPIE